MNNSFSSEIFWKIFKMFQWLFTPPMVSFLYQSDKFDIVTKFTVFTFWQVLSKTYWRLFVTRKNLNSALEWIRAPEFGIAKLM